jgi:acetyltransferase-like isoleucine patch superfamily enzyme
MAGGAVARRDPRPCREWRVVSLGDQHLPALSVDVPRDGRFMIDLLAKFVERLREGVPLSAFWRGLLLRRHFRRGAGLILSLPGGQRPVVKNSGGEIIVESGTFEAGVRIEVYRGARLTVGKGTYLNRNVHIVAAESVTIGRDVKIGWDTVIMDTDLHGHSGLPARTKPVVIEDGVWIGCRVILLKGVRVGRGAIIGAGAIVTKDIPPLAVVASPRAEVLFSVSEPSR